MISPAYTIARRDSSVASSSSSPLLPRSSGCLLSTLSACIAAVVFIATGDDLMYATRLSRAAVSPKRSDAGAAAGLHQPPKINSLPGVYGTRRARCCHNARLLKALVRARDAMPTFPPRRRFIPKLTADAVAPIVRRVANDLMTPFPRVRECV